LCSSVLPTSINASKWFSSTWRYSICCLGKFLLIEIGTVQFGSWHWGHALGFVIFGFFVFLSMGKKKCLLKSDVRMCHVGQGVIKWLDC
jgi:hypothetical protein